MYYLLDFHQPYWIREKYKFFILEIRLVIWDLGNSRVSNFKYIVWNEVRKFETVNFENVDFRQISNNNNA